MAKQNGIIKLKGTIGDIAFYKSKDGHMAREKGGVEGSRIKSDAAFQRTRENMNEFTRAGKAGKLIRLAFRVFLSIIGDGRLTSRLVKALFEVIKADSTSLRGQRNVLDGELELLEGFEFNANGNLAGALYAPFTAKIDRVTGALQVVIPAFVPGNMIVAPEGTTHVRIISGGAAIDFEGETFEVETTQSDILALTAVEVPVITLLNQLAANSMHPLFLALGIEFYQQVNGINYPLKNGNYNALALVRVLGL